MPSRCDQGPSPMPTSPRAEQSRTHGPVPGMPPGAKDHRRPPHAGLGEENCAGCCLWPSGPAFAPCPPAVAYFEVSKSPTSGARSEGGRSVALWGPRSSSPSGCASLQRPGHHHPASLAAVSGTDARVRHHIQRGPPGGIKGDCQSGSLDRQVSRRIKWRRTCHPRPCLSACRTASQPSYS